MSVVLKDQASHKHGTCQDPLLFKRFTLRNSRKVTSSGSKYIQWASTGNIWTIKPAHTGREVIA